MSYIGAEPTTAAFPFDQFSGNGTTTAFTLTYAPASATSIVVAISGVVQNPNLYSVVGTTLTFSPAPPTGTNNIAVLYLGLPVIGSSSPGNTAFLSSTDLTATASQTVFASAGSYTPGFVQVFRNGARLGNADFTATNGTTITLANAATAGDLVTIEYYTLTSLTNALPLTGGTVTGSTTFNSAVTINGAAVSGFTGMKNRIINGNMVVDQRNAGAVVTVNSSSQTFCTDRWWASGQSTDGIFTMAQSTNAPTGFNNSLQNTVTTADASIGVTQRYYIAQRIEAFNTADLGWGTAAAQTVTLSFWVRSSLTGTFGGFIYNSAANYSYPFSYSISVANTWENKTVTIAGPTAGTWLGATNGIGMQIGWSLGAGTDRLGTAGAWASAQYFGAIGQTNIIATNGATFYITGVQLEKGSTATSFDYRPYGTELALCQRYYYKSPQTANGEGFITYQASGGWTGTTCFPVTMRATPTMTYGYTTPYSGNTFNRIDTGGTITVTLTQNLVSVSRVLSIYDGGQSSIPLGTNFSTFLTASAEL